MRITRCSLIVLAALFCANAAVTFAQPVTLSKEAYIAPPKEITDAVLATAGESVTLTNLSPDGKKFLITKNDRLPSLQTVGRPYVYLAEMAFDPTAYRARDLWVRSALGYELFFTAEKRSVPVQSPKLARVGNAAWSPDGSQIAYYAHFDHGTHICVADAVTGTSRQITKTPVCATLATSFQWTRDGRQIQTVLLPDAGKRELPRWSLATAPKVRVARDGANPTRTYRYLLESPQDMQLLEQLTTGQLALVDVATGQVTNVGKPEMIRAVSMNPDGQQFRVTTVKKPFSYYVPFARFGTTEGVWSNEGKSLLTLNDRKLQENEPPPPVPTTPPAVAAGTPTGGPRGPGRGGRPAGQPPAPTPAPAPTPPVDPDPDPNPNPDPDRAPRRTEPVDPDGKRELSWRPDGQGLSYLQLEPAKAPITGTTLIGLMVSPVRSATMLSALTVVRATIAKESSAVRNDRVMQWLPPFGDKDMRVIYASLHRITNLQYSDDCQTLFLTQTVNNDRQIVAIDLNDPKRTRYVIQQTASRFGGQRPNSPEDLVTGDDEQQPGRGPGSRFGGSAATAASLLTKSSRGQGAVVRVSRTGNVYLSGSGRAEGMGFPKPYIDMVHVKTGKKTRIFEGKGEFNESIDAVDGDDVQFVYTTRQKRDVPPDSFVTDVSTGQSTKLTNNVDRFAWHRELKVERFQVTRVDGFKFWVRVTTPAKATGKLPALFWIYPREYTDQAAYDAGAGRGNIQTNRYTVPSPRSMTFLTLLGYAVVEPDVPIVGQAGRMNDNYIHDLRNGLWAVIDALDKKGVIDRDRLACGGHSYGAFSTANAMAHTPFFKAGIAGDGNYNRTLTAMTFQTERRQLWDARETYLEMSPLLWANRVNGALLMYHGMDDANVGTNPINAEHMFMALDGLGKPASLYMYPYEGHGPIARETTLDLWARWVAWLDMYVKNPQPAKKPAATKQ